MEKKLEENIIPEWKEFYINFNYFQKKLYQFEHENAENNDNKFKKDDNSFIHYEEVTEINENLLTNEQYQLNKKNFLSIFLFEVEKVEYLYKENIFYNIKRYEKIKEQLNFVKLNYQYLGTEDTLELALKELYKETHLLENYISTNLEFIYKIVDKYKQIVLKDEINQESLNKFEEHMKVSLLTSSYDKINEFKGNMKTLFEEFFTYKYKSSTNNMLENYVSSIYFTDFQIFMFKIIISCLLILIGICWVISYYYNIDMDSDSEFKYIFPMFRAYFCLCLYFWFIGINVYVWNKNKINFKLIFQLTNLKIDMISIFSKAAFFSSIFVCMYLFYMIIRTNIPIFSNIISFLSFDITPLICWIVLLIYLLCPLRDFFDYQERYYCFKLLLESIAPFLVATEFRHVFFTDQMTSMIGPIRDIEHTLCYYVHYDNTFEDKKQLCSNRRMIVLLIGVFPHFIRILQCIRIMYDTKVVYPMIINTLKYSLAIAVAIISFFSYNSFCYTMMWIAVGSISTIVSIGWDLKMDFGIAQNGSVNYPLRDNLTYKNKGLYYLCITFNIILRLIWILSTSPEMVYQLIRPELLSLIIYSLEIVRRGMWNIIRVEYKHLEVCKQFKVTMTVDLPFIKDKNGKFILRDFSISSLVKMNQRVKRMSSKFINNIIQIEKDSTLNNYNTEPKNRLSEQDLSMSLGKFLKNRSSKS